MLHALKLHPEQGQQPSTKKPVVSERYDEVVFSEPTEYFAMILDRGSTKVNNLQPVSQLGGDEEMKEDKEDLTEQKAIDQVPEGDQLNVTSSSISKADDKAKNIDRRQFAQYL